MGNKQAFDARAAVARALAEDGPAAVHGALADLRDVARFDELSTNALSWVGERVSHHVRRSLLLRVLRLQNWNLTKTGEALRIGATNVLRMIRQLDLQAEYEQAKAGGIPRRGGWPAKPSEPSKAEGERHNGDGMTRGVRPTAEQAARLKRYSQRALARETELSKDTVASAQRCEPVTRANLRAMLEAVARLEQKAEHLTRD